MAVGMGLSTVGIPHQLLCKSLQWGRYSECTEKQPPPPPPPKSCGGGMKKYGVTAAKGERA